MQVRVLYFGLLKDLAGRDSETLELPDGATLADLLAHCQSAVPRMKHLLPSIALSINQEYARPAAALHDRDEVALLPPVSGGVDTILAGQNRAAVVRSRIDVERIAESVRRPEDGAVVVFEGVVRNNTRGRRTLYLDYEAYEPMALKQLEALAGQALGEFAIREVALVHRIGRLEIGETSVAIAVASAHRAAAFDACRWLIDTLKRTVPIWKKEYFADGAVWADGEPFPPEISAAGREPASN
jgi:molybdopterin synthase catalytic subunit